MSSCSGKIRVRSNYDPQQMPSTVKRDSHSQGEPSMKHRIATIILGAATLIAPALAQPSPLQLPAPLEKELGARAANVTEVTLGKGMLDFAAKFMDKNDKDQVAVKQLIEGLD